MVGFLPRTHGSALFTRGETQAICTTTLGTKDSEQMIDGLEGLSYSNFMLHYNFPPYSVGEVGRFGAPGRRDIGHGKLAWRALQRGAADQGRVPLHDPRPLRHHRVQRLVARWRPSAAAALSMMDAGVPIEAPGLGHRDGPDPRRRGLHRALRHPRRRGSPRRHGLQGGRHRPRASPRCRWTSRSPASPARSFAAALNQAKEGRAHILGEMTKALGSARTELSAHAPRIETMQIDKSKIREVIGTGGKVIREIVAETGAKVDIDDEGLIKISSSDLSADRGRAQVDPRHRRGSRSRQDLRRQGRQHRRFRRVRELHGRQGRSRPRLRDEATSGSRSRPTSSPKARQ